MGVTLTACFGQTRSMRMRSRNSSGMPKRRSAIRGVAPMIQCWNYTLQKVLSWGLVSSAFFESVRHGICSLIATDLNPFEIKINIYSHVISPTVVFRIA